MTRLKDHQSLFRKRFKIQTDPLDHPGKLPGSQRNIHIRHAGSIEEAYTLMGLTYVQTGKDLTPVTNLVVTGGSLIHTTQTSEIASYALYDPAQPMSLRPKEARVLVDRQYILSAMGLLAASHPACALRIMKRRSR